MQMTAKAWLEYIGGMSSIDQKAVTLMQQWIDKHGTDDRTSLIAYADALIQRYGQASGALACEMYEATAAAQGVTVPAAEMASLPTYEEVGKAINGTLKVNQKVPNTVGRLVKRVGADTTLKNAKRDGAQFAWVPHGDTCAFCITLASRGWQYMSKNALRNGHAEHIHVNCDCQYAIRLDGKSTVEGYDPDKYKRIYDAMSGKTSEEKINSLRRALNGKNALTIDQLDFTIKLEKNPSMLGKKTPSEWKTYLGKLGFQVNPLGRGNLKGVSFEDGGGFRIIYRGNGYMQYHPDKFSHHDGAYYKVSSAKYGKRHFRLNGEEFYV